MVSELNIVRWTVGLLWSHFIDKHTHIVDWEREARCNYDELKERERERERVGWESGDLLWSSDRSSRKRERRTSEQDRRWAKSRELKKKKGTELNWKHTDKKRKTNAPGWRERERERERERGRNDWLWKDLMMSSAKLLIRYWLVNAGPHSFISIAEQHTHTPLYINIHIYRRLALYLLSDVVMTMETAAYRWPKG